MSLWSIVRLAADRAPKISLKHCASQPEVTITVAFRVRVASPLSSSRGGGGGVTLGAIYVRRFLREKRSSLVNLRVFYAQFTRAFINKLARTQPHCGS